MEERVSALLIGHYQAETFCSINPYPANVENMVSS